MTRCLSLMMICLAAAPIYAGELFIASYNIENLFHPSLTPGVEADDAEFTPTGKKKWDDNRVARKIKNLSNLIKKMNDGAGPDILGLCEVENRDMARMLADAIAQGGRQYDIVHRDSPSKRGIDCAILFDRTKLQLASSRFHPVGSLRTREIVEAEFLLGDKRLTVFMNHWPSQNNPAADRILAAKTLRQRLNQLQQNDALMDVIVMGDLNEKDNSNLLKEHLGVVNDPKSLTGRVLYNTMAPIFAQANRGTYVFQNKWETIDHILISQGLVDPAGFRWKDGSTTEHRSGIGQMYTPPDAKQIPRPNRSFTGDLYHPSGISDHLPVTCVLTY